MVVNLGNGRLKKVIHKEKSSAHGKNRVYMTAYLNFPEKRGLIKVHVNG